MSRSAALLLIAGLSAACFTDPGELTRPPPGDHKAYRPFAHVSEIAKFAGKDAKLISIEAIDVPTGGKVELGSKTDTGAMRDVELVFHAKSTKEDRKHEWSNTEIVKVTVTVMNPRTMKQSTDGGRSWSEYVHKGMERKAGVSKLQWRKHTKYAPPPKCKASKLWKIAKKNGAPKTPATIKYDHNGYTLHDLKFDPDCKLIKQER